MAKSAPAGESSTSANANVHEIVMSDPSCRRKKVIGRASLKKSRTARMMNPEGLSPKTPPRREETPAATRAIVPRTIIPPT